MGKQPTNEHNNGDCRTFRITRNVLGGNAMVDEKEVLALYYQHEEGFVVFKDHTHAIVYAVAGSAVTEIERLDAPPTCPEVLEDVIRMVATRSVESEDDAEQEQLRACILALDRLRAAPKELATA